MNLKKNNMINTNGFKAEDDTLLPFAALLQPKPLIVYYLCRLITPSALKQTYKNFV